MAARTLLAADAKSLAGATAAVPSHFAPKAKRVIYLFQSGGPSHIDLFDYKPHLEKVHGEDLPDSVRQGQRLTGMTSGQKSFPVCKSLAHFEQRGESGQWISDLLPYTCKVADHIAVIRSMHTDDYSYNITENPVHIRDLNATILNCLGMDHNRFTFRFQGLNHKPTGVEPAKVVKGILA